MRQSLSLFTTFILGAIIFGTSSVHAESTVSTIQVNYNLRHNGIKINGAWDVYPLMINKPNVTIEYHASILDTDSGIPVACGSSVPAGTRLTFKFDKHSFNDIRWMTTGGQYDSPFGDWSTDATPPSNIECNEQSDYTFRDTGTINARIYVPLRVNPPNKSVTGLEGLECDLQSDGSQICTTSTPGELPSFFNFSDTSGLFYSRVIEVNRKNFLNKCRGDNEPLKIHPAGKITYILPVPPQSISCPITITEPPPGTEPPSPPSLSASAGASCVVNTPHTITMTSTDADGDDVRYGIDWDNDGSINEFKPPPIGPVSQYVPSGTTLTASRTYATAGSKTVRVIAQDEHGLTSTSATLTFSCANAPTPTPPSSSGSRPQCSNDIDDDGLGGMDLADPDCTDASDTSEFSGAIPPPAGSSGPGGSSRPDLSIRAKPSIVRRGNTTQIHWSATNVSSCTTSAPNTTPWTELISPVPFGRTSQPIEARTVYTLRCVDLSGNTHTKTAVVNILPVWREPPPENNPNDGQ